MKLYSITNNYIALTLILTTVRLLEATTSKLSTSLKYEYNETACKYAFKFSQVSYCDHKTIWNWKCGESCDRVPDVTDVKVYHTLIAETQGYTAYDPSQNAIVVAFRGTEDPINWIENIDFKLKNWTRCEGCQIHGGFSDDYNSIKDLVLNDLKLLRKKYKTAQIFITGHSLGSILAVLTTLDTQYLNISQIEFLYTFENPRLGNKAFAQYFNEQIPHAFRTAHFKDVVPHLPPSDYEFHHIATEVYYDEWSRKHIICDGSGEDKHCSDKFGDHALSAYDHLHIFGQYTGCIQSDDPPKPPPPSSSRQNQDVQTLLGNAFSQIK